MTVKNYEEKVSILSGNWGNTLKVLQSFYDNPLQKASEIVSKTNLSFPTVNNILKRLENIGILEELTNYKRNKIYVLMEYLSIFIEGIE